MPEIKGYPLTVNHYVTSYVHHIYRKVAFYSLDRPTTIRAFVSVMFSYFHPPAPSRTCRYINVGEKTPPLFFSPVFDGTRRSETFSKRWPTSRRRSGFLQQCTLHLAKPSSHLCARLRYDLKGEKERKMTGARMSAKGCSRNLCERRNSSLQATK